MAEIPWCGARISEGGLGEYGRTESSSDGNAAARRDAKPLPGWERILGWLNESTKDHTDFACEAWD